MSKYGNKYDNIEKLYQNEKLHSYIPYAFPFSLKESELAYIDSLYSSGNDNLFEELVELLQCNYSDCFEKIEQSIGSLPWIIRSSGDEDSIDNPNAGAYESYCCYQKEKFYVTLAKTLLSANNDHAVNQDRLIYNAKAPRIIPVFIQSLVVGNEIANEDYVPMINEEKIRDMIEILMEIHHELNLELLDTEWVIESDEGIISATSISKMDGMNGIQAELSLGFGLFSTQHVCRKVTQILYNADTTIQYKKNNFLKVNVLKVWVIQARAAHKYFDYREVPLMEESTIQMLNASSGVLNDEYEEVLVLGRNLEPAKVIVTRTLVQAWDVYIHLTDEQQKKVGYVIVQVGSQLEHAGIMFNETGITVIKSNRVEKLLSLKNATCCVDFKNKRTYLSKNDCIKEIYYEKKSTFHFTKDYYSLFLDKSIESLEKTHLEFSSKKEMYLYPKKDCMIIAERNIYAPCYLHEMVRVAVASGLSIEECYKKLPQMEHESELYVNSFYTDKIKENYQFNMFSWVKDEMFHGNNGLLWLLMKLEEEVTESELIREVYHCFEVQPYTSKRKYIIVNQLLTLKDNINSINCFKKDEIASIYQAVARMLCAKRENKERIEDICDIISDDSMSPYYIQYFLDDNQVNELLIMSYHHLKNSIKEFSASDDGDINEKSIKLIQDYQDVKRHCKNDIIINACYHNIVETFDNTAKVIAGNIVRSYSRIKYDLYLNVLKCFLNFIENGTERKYVVEIVRAWFQQIKIEEEREHGYDLQEYDIRAVIRDMQKDKEVFKFENIHQVHNFLHQWALYEAPNIQNSNLCRNVNKLLAFCNTFCTEESHVLMARAKLLEINLPMCTHKASFQLLENGFRLEFSEPPETENSNIGRLVALDNMISLFFDATFKLEHFYEKQLGTWTWIVYAEVEEKETMFGKFEYFVKILRFLLDACYDFSHTPIESIENVEDYYNEPEWKKIFNHVLEYRKNIYDVAQFTELKTFAYSDFITQLSINEKYRENVLKCYQLGFEGCFKELKNIVSSLTSVKNPSEWASCYEILKSVIVVLESVWPKETLERLTKWQCTDYIKILLYKNLLLRKDIQIIIKQNLDKYDREMLLHSVPHLLIRENTVPFYCEFLLSNRSNYKMAKQFLLYEYVEKISDKDLEELILELKWIPYPRKTEQLKRYEKTNLTYDLFDINRRIFI